MIGIGTIGRAAESGGGSTTYQNGKYIAFIMYDYSIDNPPRILYFSDNFGATFKTRTTPLPTTTPFKVYINYLGEIMLIYSTSLYYAASPTSNWVLIENQHTSGDGCAVSWDFNTIVYTKGYSTYYLSTNKGLSFTSKSIVGSSFYHSSIYTIVMSGDGTKVSVRAYSSNAGSNINTVINSITGTYITDSLSSGNYIFVNSNYYGNYFTGYSTGEPYTSYIKYKTKYGLYNLNGIYGRLAAPSNNGWATEYVNSDNTIRFYNLPSTQYKSITPPTGTIYDSSGPISGDYVYFSSAPSGATYANIYRVDNIVGHSYELINQINFGVSTFLLTRQAVSKVPPTLLI